MVHHGIFKYQLINGQLTGVYTNEHCSGQWYPEAGRRNGTFPHFTGTFDGAWFEGTGGPHISQLTISNNPGNAHIFELTWSDPTGLPLFRGTGLLVNDVLAGHYWSI